MIVILVALVGGFLFLYICTKNYKRNAIKKYETKEHPLFLLYPTAFYLLDRMRQCKMYGGDSKAKRSIQYLNQSSQEEQLLLYELKKISTFLLIILLSTLVGIVAEGSYLQTKKSLEKGIIKRPNGSINQQRELYLTVDGKEDSMEHIILDISPRNIGDSSIHEIEDEELEKLQEERQRHYEFAYEYIDSVVLGNNDDLDCITSSLYFPKTIPDTTIHMEWNVSIENSMYDKEDNINSMVVDQDGTVWNESLEQPVAASIEATIYEDETIVLGKYVIHITIVPKSYQEYTDWKERLQEWLRQREKNSRMEESVILPLEYEGKQLVWREKKTYTSIYVFALAGILCIALHIGMNEDLEGRVKSKRKQMIMDYPDVVNKLTLLIGAGMTVSGAWERIVADYTKLKNQQECREQNNKSRRRNKKTYMRYAYEEMMATNQEIRMGISEAKAIEAFGKRSGVMEYIKLSTALIQNMKKGASGLTQVLDLMAVEAFDRRKQTAKQLGEEAGTKLLLPMTIMLVLVLLLIMIPAFWSMKI